MPGCAVPHRSATVLLLGAACASVMFGGLAGCAASDTGTANIAVAAPATAHSVRMGAGDELGLSLHHSDQIWAHVQTSND